MSDSFISFNASSNFFRYCVGMVNPSKVFVYTFQLTDTAFMEDRD